MDKSKISAQCFDCGWYGSKYKMTLSVDGNHCPRCNSLDTAVFSTDKSKDVAKKIFELIHTSTPAL